MSRASVGAICVVLALLSAVVDAYYCDHDLCTHEQYCCGDNLCCDYASWWSWYVWVALLFVLGLSGLLWGCLRYICVDRYRHGDLEALTGSRSGRSSIASTTGRPLLNY